MHRYGRLQSEYNMSLHCDHTDSLRIIQDQTHHLPYVLKQGYRDYMYIDMKL